MAKTKQAHHIFHDTVVPRFWFWDPDDAYFSESSSNLPEIPDFRNENIAVIAFQSIECRQFAVRILATLHMLQALVEMIATGF